MAKGDQYRRYAAECVRLARRTDDDNEKSLLLQMAEQWRQLANRAQQEESRQEKRPQEKGEE